MTRIETITDVKKDMAILQSAAEILRCGGLVAFPTETVYGLGANALNENAVRKIYKAKGRPCDNPLIVHLAQTEEVFQYARPNEAAMRLMEAFWPGPLTLVMKKKPVIVDEATSYLDTCAFRVPAHEVAHALLKAAGVPIAAPSANVSGRPSTTRAQHVIDDLDGRVDMILCAGASLYGLESTVLNVAVEPAVIHRPGFITKADLEAVIQKPIVESDQHHHVDVPRSPGMKYTHYAPNAKIHLVKGGRDRLFEQLEAFCHTHPDCKVCVLIPEEYADRFSGYATFLLGRMSDPSQIAASLFERLRAIDKRAYDVIYAPVLEGDGLVRAVMNRLTKASSCVY